MFSFPAKETYQVVTFDSLLKFDIIGEVLGIRFELSTRLLHNEVSGVSTFD